MLLLPEGLQSIPCGSTCGTKVCLVSNMRWTWQTKLIWMQPSKGGGKGASIGKGSRHWTAPFVYSSSSNPYPIELQVVGVERVAFSWDEYADKVAMTPANWTPTRPQAKAKASS